MINQLNKLICPYCRKDLDFEETSLFCHQCRRNFAIKNNLVNFSPDKFFDQTDSRAASWKKSEIEQFDDLDSYQELMSRPYFQYLKSKIGQHILTLDLKNKNIVEVGAGRSIFAAIFDNSNKVILIDINEKLLGQNKNKYLLVVADAEYLPFKNNSFDFVYAIGLIHHLPNQAKGLQELKRVTKSDGRIFISEPTKWSLNLIYYLGRQLLLKILGAKALKKLIGCATPYESFIDLNKAAYVFKEWNIKKRYLLPLRLPPIKVMDRIRWPIAVNKFLEKLPFVKRLGTIVFLDIFPLSQDRGYGTAYEKFILKRLFKKIIEKYRIKSVQEFPANNLMGNHQEVFANLGVEIKKNDPGLVWNFCEFDYAKPKDFLNDLNKLNASYFAIITQNNKNLGVWLHRFYHWLLGRNWNHGKIRNMSFKKVINSVKDHSDLKIQEVIAFDVPWFILDVYETGQLIKRFLPPGLSSATIKPSIFESRPFSLKKFLAHHFLVLIKRK